MWRSVALAVRSKCRSVIHSACRFLSRLTFTVVDVACERLSFHLRATARARNPACLVNDEQQLHATVTLRDHDGRPSQSI
jgi:hypothetical protein